MESNSFFLQRAIARGAELQVSYPALCMASSTDTVDERRKQIVVATADDSHIRMIFFSSLGAILDFHASWDDLDDATRGWLAFTVRWNRWWLPNIVALAAIERHAQAPTDARIANGVIDCRPADDAALRRYLDAIEMHYRRDEAISRVLFPREGSFALQSRPHAA
ncbi:hypothetical protein [Paraburkholderia sp. RL17-337-BIB-A]|uniref:hypothetical protein n=1 Tax=Paraburkholderia sp. RL17-337-BIB-A TaxID=3031636 RepID=UPI0038BDA315